MNACVMLSCLPGCTTEWYMSCQNDTECFLYSRSIYIPKGDQIMERCVSIPLTFHTSIRKYHLSIKPL